MVAAYDLSAAGQLTLGQATITTTGCLPVAVGEQGTRIEDTVVTGAQVQTVGDHLTVSHDSLSVTLDPA